MFKSITYLGWEVGLLSDYLYHFNLIDDNFECKVVAHSNVYKPAPISDAISAAAMSAAIIEYDKRNVSLINNLYFLDNYLLKNSNLSFKKLLDIQNKYIDRHFAIPGIIFSKDIYPELLKMHEKLSTFE